MGVARAALYDRKLTLHHKCVTLLRNRARGLAVGRGARRLRKAWQGAGRQPSPHVAPDTVGTSRGQPWRES